MNSPKISAITDPRMSSRASVVTNTKKNSSRISPRASVVAETKKNSPRSPKSPKISTGTESGSSFKSIFISAELYKNSPKVTKSSRVSPSKMVMSPGVSPKNSALKNKDSKFSLKKGIVHKGIFH